jgi:Fur family transcriptional regulator, peroxide stress response regulator
MNEISIFFHILGKIDPKTMKFGHVEAQREDSEAGGSAILSKIYVKVQHLHCARICQNDTNPSMSSVSAQKAEVLRGSRSPVKKAALRMAFRAAGMRLTRQRLAIYRELTSRYDHPDVEMLFKAVKPRIPQISLFTVYRTMNAMETAGMAWRVATWKGHARYDGNVETHGHFLCERCGRIHDLDLTMDDIGPLCKQVAGEKGKVRRVDLMFYGLGPNCQVLHEQDAQKTT